MKRRPLNQAGDTIIEVLMTLIVVGLAIGIGYGIASRSLKSNRQAQERTQAVKLVESQVEQMKKAAPNAVAGASGTIFSQAGPFCMINGAPVAVSGDNCTQNTLYKITVTEAANYSPTTPQFDVTATWDGITGKQENVTVTYRVYPKP